MSNFESREQAAPFTRNKTVITDEAVRDRAVQGRAAIVDAREIHAAIAIVVGDNTRNGEIMGSGWVAAGIHLVGYAMAGFCRRFINY